MKIRYYGILGNRNKKKKLLKCKILTRTKIYKKKELPALELLKKVLGKDFNLCPQCKKGHMLMPNTGFRVYRKLCVKFKNKPSYDKIKMS